MTLLTKTVKNHENKRKSSILQCQGSLAFLQCNVWVGLYYILLLFIFTFQQVVLVLSAYSLTPPSTDQANFLLLLLLFNFTFYFYFSLLLFTFTFYFYFYFHFYFLLLLLLFIFTRTAHVCSKILTTPLRLQGSLSRKVLQQSVKFGQT